MQERIVIPFPHRRRQCQEDGNKVPETESNSKNYPLYDELRGQKRHHEHCCQDLEQAIRQKAHVKWQLV